MSIPEQPGDEANGYEALAHRFMAARGQSGTGVATVRGWAESLPSGASILDLGCGHGVPIAEALIGDGFTVHGVDASRTLAAEFEKRFPQAVVACETVESSTFFGRAFDGAVAIGLIFLLPPEAQAGLISRVAPVLKPGGQFLFTAPTQRGTWTDVLTGRETVSLGDRAYRRILRKSRLRVIDEYVDEGESHYYACVKPAGSGEST